MFGHAVRLEQVVVNLLVNALDSVQGTANPDVGVTVGADGAAVTITVHDNGTGIDETLRDRITEPFFTTKQTGEGLGLGLAISRAIVEELGGTLRFADRAHGGSVFTVTLPAAPEAARPAAAAAE